VISGGWGAPEAAASAFDDPPDRGEHALAHPRTTKKVPSLFVLDFV